MARGMRIASGKRTQDLLIADYRIEDRADGAFDVLIRRVFTFRAVVTFGVLALFAGIGVFMLWSVLGQFLKEITSKSVTTLPATGGRHGGSMFCPAVISVLFMSVWFWIISRMIMAQIARLRGQERWMFSIGGATPPEDSITQQKAIVFVEPGATRCGVTQIGARSVLGITSGTQEMVVGPFLDRSVADRLARDLQRRRPNWFGTEFGIESITPLDPSSPQDSIESIETVSRDAHCLTIDVHRKRTPTRRGNGFLIFWLCGWLAGEIFVGRLCVIEWLRRFGVMQFDVSTSHRSPPIVFLSAWVVFWTVGGIVAMRQLLLRYRTRERWEFSREQIVAGPNWQLTSTRTVRIGLSLTMRSDGTSVQFLSDGGALTLGPFRDTAERDRLIRDLKAQHPIWNSTRAP